MTIAAVLQRAAERWPDAPALVDDATGRSWTFRELRSECLAAGQFLRRTLRPGDRVALLSDAQPEYLFADYGAMAAGLVRVPLDPSLTPAELASQVRDAGAKLVLASRTRMEPASQLGVEVLPVEGLKAEPKSYGWDTPFDALASLNYTGGTSSEPKAVMLTQTNLRAIVQNVAMARGTQPGEAMLNVRPLWPIAAVIVLAHLAAGGLVVLGGSFEPRRFVELLRRHRAQSTSLVPTHLVRLLREVPAAELGSLDHLRAIDVGAAAIPPETFEALLAAVGPKIGVLYGLTEASWSCYQPPEMLSGRDAGPQGLRRERLRSAGRPVFGCDLMIGREDGSSANPGEPGEVLIRGAHVMKGYWNRPELTAQALRGGWFHTGDQGMLDDEGVLSITGRIKEVIRSGGKSVLPEEVEAALLAHPAVAEAAVVGLPDAEWGEVVAAAVVGAVDAGTLAAHCAGLLSPHKRPKRIVLVESLPRSHYGKVQRAKLRAILTGG